LHSFNNNGRIFTKRLWPILCGRYRPVTLPVTNMVFYVAFMVVADMVCGRYRCNSIWCGGRQYFL